MSVRIRAKNPSNVLTTLGCNASGMLQVDDDATQVLLGTVNTSVAAVSSALSDVSTATLQGTINTSVAAVSSALSDVSTATLQGTGNSALSAISGKLPSVLSSDRLKVESSAQVNLRTNQTASVAATSSNNFTGIDVSSYKRFSVIVSTDDTGSDSKAQVQWSGDNSQWYSSDYIGNMSQRTDVDGANSQTVMMLEGDNKAKYLRVQMYNGNASAAQVVVEILSL
jgi:hypothetical protein